MTHFVPVTHPVYYAAHRFGLIGRAGGRVRRVGALTEFVTPGGEVLCRKVGGEHWLRVDLAEAAEAALHAEAAESARIAADVIAWSLGRDSERAAASGQTVEQYRQKRNAIGHRQTMKRGLQNAGMS